MALLRIRSRSAGISGFSRTGAIGAWWRIASKTTAEVVPVKACCPVAISYRTTPKEKMSVRASSASPRACSGDM
jgi:hypothetical protein